MTVNEVAKAGSVSLDYLKRSVSNKHVLLFGKYCNPWEEIGPLLGHSTDILAAIWEDNHNAELRRIAVIQKWKEATGFKATYYSFIEVLINCKKVQSAYEICCILGEEGW